MSEPACASGLEVLAANGVNVMLATNDEYTPTPAISHAIYPYGFKATFNATYPGKTDNRCGWVSPWHYGLNQGPLVLMIENYRSELLWRLTRQCAYIVSGLRRAGFDGGWLLERSL